MSNFIYPISTYSAEVSPSYVAWQDVPPITTCNLSIGAPFVASLSDLWDCNRCGSETQYSIPFVEGDIIPLQIQLQDLASTDPTGRLFDLYGWLNSTTAGSSPSIWAFGAELYDQDCSLVEAYVDGFSSDYWTGWYEGTGNAQTLFVDTSRLASSVTEFQIKITQYNRDGSAANTYWSEPFRRATCEDTALIVGTYPKADCLNLRHDAPENFTHLPSNPAGYTPTNFYWSIRVWGSFNDGEYEQQREYSDKDTLLKSTTIKNYLLSFSRPIPPYFSKLLSAAIGGNVSVDGEAMREVGQIDKGAAPNRMLLPAIDMSQECEVKFFNCD